MSIKSIGTTDKKPCDKCGAKGTNHVVISSHYNILCNSCRKGLKLVVNKKGELCEGCLTNSMYSKGKVRTVNGIRTCFECQNCGGKKYVRMK